MPRNQSDARRVPETAWKNRDSRRFTALFDTYRPSSFDFGFCDNFSIVKTVVRRYVAQLASQAGLMPALVRKLFQVDVRYGIDVRYFAALLSDPKYIIKFALNGERD